jgi:hypothetical protein
MTKQEVAELLAGNDVGQPYKTPYIKFLMRKKLPDLVSMLDEATRPRTVRDMMEGRLWQD